MEKKYKTISLLHIVTWISVIHKKREISAIKQKKADKQLIAYCTVTQDVTLSNYDVCTLHVDQSTIIIKSAHHTPRCTTVNNTTE